MWTLYFVTFKIWTTSFCVVSDYGQLHLPADCNGVVGATNKWRTKESVKGRPEHFQGIGIYQKASPGEENNRDCYKVIARLEEAPKCIDGFDLLDQMKVDFYAGWDIQPDANRTAHIETAKNSKEIKIGTVGICCKLCEWVDCLPSTHANLNDEPCNDQECDVEDGQICIVTEPCVYPGIAKCCCVHTKGDYQGYHDKCRERKCNFHECPNSKNLTCTWHSDIQKSLCCPEHRAYYYVEDCKIYNAHFLSNCDDHIYTFDGKLFATYNWKTYSALTKNMNYYYTYSQAYLQPEFRDSYLENIVENSRDAAGNERWEYLPHIHPFLYKGWKPK